MKNLTFEEEKRKEFLYVLFNFLFVCVCLVFVLNFISNVLADRIYSGYVNNTGDFADNILRNLFWTISLVGPFLFFGKRNEVPFKRVLTPRKTGFLFWIFGPIATVGLSIFTLFFSDKLVSLLGNYGFIMSEYIPYTLDSEQANIVSMIVLSLLSSISGEFVYRGVITEHFRKANTGLALILPSLIAMGVSGSLVKMPFVFVSGLLLSWMYMKTSSVYLTFVCSFLRDVSLYFLFVNKNLSEHLFLISVIGGISAVVCIAILFLRYEICTVYPAPRDEDEEYLRMSAKESAAGVLKSFAFWVFVFGSAFAILFFYLSNPTVATP